MNRYEVLAPGESALAVLAAHATAVPSYDVVIVDWPLQFATRSAKGDGRSPQRHYATLPVERAALIPLRALCAPDAAVVLWETKAGRAVLDRLITIWGLRYVTRLLVWVKTNKAGDAFPYGTGYYTRANCEVAHLSPTAGPGVLPAMFPNSCWLPVPAIRESRMKCTLPSNAYLARLSASSCLLAHRRAETGTAGASKCLDFCTAR